MYIQEPALVMTHEVRRQNPHEAGKDQQSWLKLVDLFQQSRVEGLAAGKLAMIENPGGDACLACSLQAIGIATVADDTADLGVERAFGNGIDQCLEIGARAGNQYHQAG